MTKQEYLEKKKALTLELENLKKTYLEGIDYHEGDIVLDVKTGEEVKIAKVLLCSDGSVGVESVYKKKKDGTFSSKSSYNHYGVFVKGRVVDVFNR